MSQTYTVNSQSQLLTALAAASGGDVIRLEGGDYGKLSLTAKSGLGMAFSGNVTITSADADNPARFSELELNGAANVTFDTVTFDYTFKGSDPVSLRPFAVSNSTNITFRNTTFDGDLAQGVSATADGFGTGIGLGISTSQHIRVENSEFFNFHRGLIITASRDIDVTGNDVHSMRSDGMNFVEVSDVVIEGNHIHDFRQSASSTDHLDMIQFWTNGTYNPSTDIIIRGNLLDIGSGDWAQSIFMRNEMVDTGQAGTEMYYRNVLIEQNVIVNGHLHGITVGETAGLTIRNNSVLHADGGTVDGLDSAVEIPRINVAVSATGVIITNNLTGGVTAAQPGWTVSGNGIVQDQNPLTAGYYEDIFLSSSLDPVNGQHGFILLPGSSFDLANIGADATQPDIGNGLSLARFNVSAVSNSGAARIFDASFTRNLPEGTRLLWDFGDGTSSDGTVVKHTYTAGGIYTARLTLTLPDGSVYAADLDVAVSGPKVLELGSSGNFIAYENGSAIALARPAAGSTQGLQLGAAGVSATVAREHVIDLAQSNEFSIGFRLQADQSKTYGELFRLHGSLVAAVNTAGELVVTLVSATTGKATVLTTKGANLANLKAHDLAIQMVDGMVSIVVDGRNLLRTAFNDRLYWAGTQELTFGNPWGSKNFHGDLKAFAITVDGTDYPSYPLSQLLTNTEGTNSSTLTGGAGSDIYAVTTSAATIHDISGIDEVRSATVSLDLSAQGMRAMENGRLLDGRDLDLTGNDKANRLTGNAGQNTLDGGRGADTLQGGGGSDTYVVDSQNDRVAELAQGGTDTVHSAAARYTLTVNVENGVLTAGGAALTGNALANSLVGNAGNNRLDGAAGADLMIGGAGNDTYVVDNRNDRIVEQVQGGTDTLRSSALSYKLAPQLENGVLLAGGRALTGNDRANMLVGNATDNRLDGGAGADILRGGAGDDLYVVDRSSDRILEASGGGRDLVHSAAAAYTLASQVEDGRLLAGGQSLTGNGLANTLTGNAAANRIDGAGGHDVIQSGGGADRLTGGTGQDTLTGGGGPDVFVFATGDGRDVITDFAARGAGHDILDLRGLITVTSFADLVANHLSEGAGDVTLRAGGDTITLQGVQLEDLSARDFLF